jgi:hydroxypyruvate isomerase
MNRRSFLAAAAAGVAAVPGAAAALPAATRGAQAADTAPGTSGGKFKLGYAPGFGTFRAHAGSDPVDHVRFAADQGFRAMFDNGLMGRPTREQERIAEEMRNLDMTWGPFVLFADWGKPTLVTDDPAVRERIVAKASEAVETARRTGAKQALLVPGLCSQRLEWDYQTANVIEHLRRVMEVVEPHGLVVVIEPLNWWANHPGLFLQKIPQAYQICKAVASPCCKIVNDLYHQQISEGNLIPNIDRAWDEIAAFHVGDNPGRNEPTTGEIHYRNVFRHLYRKGYPGVLCMEHGNSKGSGKEAEKSLIAAYRECDGFEA